MPSVSAVGTMHGYAIIHIAYMSTFHYFFLAKLIELHKNELLH